MMPDKQWIPFLHDRGIDPMVSTMARLLGGEVNDNWRIDSAERTWVLRHYQQTSDPAEVECELAAVDHLGHSGFPTPAPVPASAVGGERRLWEPVAGRPAALFPFVHGQHPPERPGGYGSMDLELGERSARLAGRLHLTLAGSRLAGRRSQDRDPWRQISRFLASGLANHPEFAELREPLQEIRSRLEPIYRAPRDLPAGLIHNDIGPPNLLLDAGQEIVSLLDFDDSVQTFLAYELAAIISTFGKDQDRRIEIDKVANLVAAYDAVRPITRQERALLPDLLIAHAGAEGVKVLSHWLANGRDNARVTNCYSARQFLELSALRSRLCRTLL